MWDGMECDERDTLIEGDMVGSERNPVLGKFPGMHKNDPILDRGIERREGVEEEERRVVCKINLKI